MSYSHINEARFNELANIWLDRRLAADKSGDKEALAEARKACDHMAMARHAATQTSVDGYLVDDRFVI